MIDTTEDTKIYYGHESSKVEIANEWVDAAYRSFGKQIFTAKRNHTGSGSTTYIILADSLEEAREKIKDTFGSAIFTVQAIVPTESSQIYEICDI